MLKKSRGNGVSYPTDRPPLHAFPIAKLAEEFLSDSTQAYNIIRLPAPTIPPRDVEEDLSKSLREKRGSTSRTADF
eukprot:9773315-Heterocapsa_arctica.AAC.1